MYASGLLGTGMLGGTKLVQIGQSFDLALPCPPFHDLKDLLDRLAFGVHVHMGVDVHRGPGICMAGERLHHLGMNSPSREHGEIGVPELVKAPAAKPETLPVLVPPPAEAGRLDPLPAFPRNDRVRRTLLDITLPRVPE